MKCRNILSTILVVFIFSLSVSTTASAVHSTPPWYAPLLSLPHTWQPSVHCLIRAESRSTFAHPNLGDDNGNMPGQSGIFQMANYVGGVWDTYAMPRLHIVLWRASAYQQAEGFVLVLRLDGGFHPWHGDGCAYPN